MPPHLPARAYDGSGHSSWLRMLALAMLSVCDAVLTAEGVIAVPKATNCRRPAAGSARLSTCVLILPISVASEVAATMRLNRWPAIVASAAVWFSATVPPVKAVSAAPVMAMPWPVELVLKRSVLPPRPTCLAVSVMTPAALDAVMGFRCLAFQAVTSEAVRAASVSPTSNVEAAVMPAAVRVSVPLPVGTPVRVTVADAATPAERVGQRSQAGAVPPLSL
jgi:hypothetical protein